MLHVEFKLAECDAHFPVRKWKMILCQNLWSKYSCYQLIA